MSQMAPEAAPQAPPRKENVLTRKIGPLPTWGWVAIGGGGILAWAYFKRKKGGGGLFGGGKPGKHKHQEGAGGKPQAFLVPPYVGVWTYQAFPPENEAPEKGEPVAAHMRKRHRRGEDNENLEPEAEPLPQPGHHRKPPPGRIHVPPDGGP